MVRDTVRGNASTGRMRLQWWRDVISQAYGSETGYLSYRGHSVADEVVKAVQQHGQLSEVMHIDGEEVKVEAPALTRRWFDRIIDAREADIEGVRWNTVTDMERYAEHTASSLNYLP